MPSPRLRARPGVEPLGARLLLSTMAPGVPTPSASVENIARPVPGSFPRANLNRTFTPADLQAYASAYLATSRDADFTPQYDFNGAGFIGQNDATPILRGLAGITPKVPLTLNLALATGEQVHGHHPAVNGGATRLGTVTVVGRTTPNSIVFIDGPTQSPHAQPTGNFKFEGGALATDSRGIFRYTLDLAPLSTSGSLTAPAFLIRTPSGQQTIRSFPIFRIR